MDQLSKNYDSKAKEDNGSCTYEGRVVFWYKQAVADQLAADSIQTLNYFLDGVSVGSGASSVAWPTSPNCGENGSITVNRDLGTTKKKDFGYVVKNEDGFEVFSGIVTIEANLCKTVEL